jgi:hypothetical protein
MSAASNQAGNTKGGFFGQLLNLSFGRKSRRKSADANRARRSLQFEGLEKRELFSVNSRWFTNVSADLVDLNPGLTGQMLVVATDNFSTKVEVSKVGSYIRITEVNAGADRTWDYLASTVKAVEFRGGNGNDRFVNNVANLPSSALGDDGHDFLHGNSAGDYFNGGIGDDVLLGYGAGDLLLGGDGNDYCNGLAGHDEIWGQKDNDTLLGGSGDDELYGSMGNDHLNGQAGADSLYGESGNDTLIALDEAYTDYLDGGANADTLWIDKGQPLNISGRIYAAPDDSVANATSGDVVQAVVSFANGADRSLDFDDIADPTDMGANVRYTNTITPGNTKGDNPLFDSGGPSSSDVNQNAIGDCWLLSGLAAITRADADVIRQNVVDFNDKTYGVRLGNKFYRVDSQLSKSGSKLGDDGEMWVPIVEKAYAHYRRGANTYASLNSGFSKDLFSALGLTNVDSKALKNNDWTTAATMAAALYAKWQAGYALAIGSIAFINGGYHEFSVERFVLNTAGKVASIVLRNPWGTDGHANFPAFKSAAGGTLDDGRFTVSISQLFNSGGWVEWGRT